MSSKDDHAIVSFLQQVLGLVEAGAGDLVVVGDVEEYTEVAWVAQEEEAKHKHHHLEVFHNGRSPKKRTKHML